MGLAHWSSLVYPCQSFSFTLFFRLIPWSIEAPCVHLSAWVSKTWTGRCSVSSLPWETGRAPVASVNRANFLSWSFIGCLCKPRNISLFLSPIFLSTTFFPNLSFLIKKFSPKTPTLSPLLIPWIHWGWTLAGNDLPWESLAFSSLFYFSFQFMLSC